MAVAWQHISVYLVSHSLAECIGIGWDIKRCSLQDFVVIGEGKKLSDNYTGKPPMVHRASPRPFPLPELPKHRLQGYPQPCGLELVSCLASPGLTSSFALARNSSSSFFFSRRSSRASDAFVAESTAMAPHSALVMARSGSSSKLIKMPLNQGFHGLHPRFEVFIGF